MKKWFLILVLALVAVPATLRAEAAPAPVTAAKTALSPVDELIKLMNRLYALMGKDMTTDNMSPDQLNQFLQVAQEIENLKAKNATYKLTATDRESLVRWARTTNERINGEKMTAAEVAELRNELNGFTTFADLTEELEPTDF